jgi:hypothetical protein
LTISRRFKALGQNDRKVIQHLFRPGDTPGHDVCTEAKGHEIAAGLEAAFGGYGQWSMVVASPPRRLVASPFF